MVVSGLRAQSEAGPVLEGGGAALPEPDAPSLSRLEPIKTGQSFRMECVVFARAYGYSSCGELPAKGGLAGHGGLPIHQSGRACGHHGGRRVLFCAGYRPVPPRFRRRMGAPSCVMASNYKGY